MKAHFFSTANEFRQWLEKNHSSEKELLVGYYKKASGIPSMTWSESVDQALCFGWIDGIRRSIDDKSYSIRFTPRKRNSIWSAVNLKKMEVLQQQKLMRPAGLAIFEQRNIAKINQYAYEKKIIVLNEEYLQQIKANPKAWTFFENLAPSYKKISSNWVMTAKKEETQLRRLNILIESSAEQLKIPMLRKKR